ncbi:hypothetical protein K3495_g11694 [Podosphaera aphanis]|nr:hypothetical protein K3495_g11694 [Podosphaera aphanis]
MSTLSSPRAPWGLQWRSSTSYILTTITIAIFTDLFLYGLIVPIIPFILTSRLHVSHDDIQGYTSFLLAAYAGSSFLASLPVGYIADRLPSRQISFLTGLFALFLSTALLWVGQTFPILVIARIFQGISASVVWTTGLAMIVDTVGSHRLGVIVGSIFSVISVGQLVAPVLGGIVYGRFGEGWVFGMGFALLAIDFAMRLFIIEKKIAKNYNNVEDLSSSAPNQSSETSPLLSTSDQSETSKIPEIDLAEWKNPPNLPTWAKKLPMLYIIYHSPRLVTAQVLGFTQALMLAIFDATIPIQSLDLFSFTPLHAGLIFIPLLFPELVFGPIAGLCVDRFGTKWPSVFGLFFLVLPLSLLGCIHSVAPGEEGYITEILKFSMVLAGCGVGLALIGSQSIVDASIVVGFYEQANPDWFPEGGPYAQLYAVNGMVFSLGLAVGPLFASFIKETYSYAIMNFCVAGLCIAVGVLCATFMGGTPECLKKIWHGKQEIINGVMSES